MSIGIWQIAIVSVHTLKPFDETAVIDAVKNTGGIITVEENPIIENITFNGIKSNTLKDKIIKNLSLKERSSYNEVLLKKDKNSMLASLKDLGYYKRNDEQIGGIVGSTSSAGTLDGTSAALGQVAKDQVTNFAATGATSGIGILKKTGSAVLAPAHATLELFKPHKGSFVRSRSCISDAFRGIWIKRCCFSLLYSIWCIFC